MLGELAPDAGTVKHGTKLQVMYMNEFFPVAAGDVLEHLVGELAVILVRVEPLVDALALHGQDLVEPLAEIVENARQVVALELTALLFAQLLEHVAQPLQIAALRHRHAATEQVAHGPAQVAVFDQIVRHGAQDLVRVQWQLLTAVPVAEAMADGRASHLLTPSRSLDRRGRTC